MTERAERRAMIALVMVFAFLVQMLAPALAEAAPVSGGATTICTSMGLQTVDNDGDEAPRPSHDCQHCISAVAIEPTSPAAVATAVIYGATLERVQNTPRGLRPQARAPPRPPGQGPPLPNA